jgi:primosomal protein N''
MAVPKMAIKSKSKQVQVLKQRVDELAQRHEKTSAKVEVLASREELHAFSKRLEGVTAAMNELGRTKQTVKEQRLVFVVLLASSWAITAAAMIKLFGL